MPTATVLIRHLPEFRLKAFVEGLKKHGFRVNALTSFQGANVIPNPGDILVIWNRVTNHDILACKFEAAGNQVLVAENGWLGLDKNGAPLYAISRSKHNGAGSWYVGYEDRWTGLGIKLKPWRSSGGRLLLLPQRGIGSPGVRMPQTWVKDTTEAIRKKSKRKIVLRKHPGNWEQQLRHPLEPELKDCWAAVTWASGAAIKAIVNGTPVFYGLKNWIGAPAAKYGLSDLENPFLGDREPMLHRLAWAQWTLEEISKGTPFYWLLNR